MAAHGSPAVSELLPVVAKPLPAGAVDTVDARDLYAFLGVGKDFSTWIKGRIAAYAFEEGRDFLAESRSPERGSGNRGAGVTYYLTLDMAKELAMVERTEKGKQARAYFIECERIAKSAASQPDPIALLNDPATMRGLLLTYSEKVLALQGMGFGAGGGEGHRLVLSIEWRWADDADGRGALGGSSVGLTWDGRAPPNSGADVDFLGHQRQAIAAGLSFALDEVACGFGFGTFQARGQPILQKANDVPRLPRGGANLVSVDCAVEFMGFDEPAMALRRLRQFHQQPERLVAQLPWSAIQSHRSSGAAYIEAHLPRHARRERGWIYRHPVTTIWTAYQSRVDSKHLEQRKTTITQSNGRERTVPQCLVLPRGLALLAEAINRSDPTNAAACDARRIAVSAATSQH